jgi:hypothetical protein
MAAEEKTRNYTKTPWFYLYFFPVSEKSSKNPQVFAVFRKNFIAGYL